MKLVEVNKYLNENDHENHL